MVGVDEDDDLGPWADADLGATAKIDLGIGADGNQPPEIRFLRNVAKLVRRRLAIKSSELTKFKQPAIFLLQPSPPPAAAEMRTKRVPMLDNALERLTRRVWFVGENPASGHYAEYDPMDDDALFTMITNQLDQSHAPAIIFDPRLAEAAIRFYPKGLQDPSDCMLIGLSSINVTFEQVVSAVDRTYREKMITPEAQPKASKLWKNEQKWWPQKNAEDLVQMYLELGLNTAFPTCKIRAEQTTPAGRLDIEIIENDAIERSIVTQHGLLELKVSRSFSESGETKYTDENRKKWIKSGVQQAASYRDEKEAKWSALLCFDMCNSDIGESEYFSHVKHLSNKLSVRLKRWYLYAKSAHFRAAQAALKT